MNASLDLLLQRTPEPRRAATRSIARELAIHQTMPAFDDVSTTGVGRVWVQEHSLDTGDPLGWTVVGADGALIAGTTLPSSWQLRDAGDDWAIVRVTDELGVEGLWLTAIEREPNEVDR